MDKKESTKIPKKIHFIWFGEKMPWYIKSYIEMTRKKYPDFKIKIWGEKDFDPRSVTYTRKAYEAKKWAFISDYLRTKILYEEGGIYLDTDMVPLGDMRPYLKNFIVLGWEYNKLVTTGFIAARPKHPFFKVILDSYESFEERTREFNFLVNNELFTFILKNNYGLLLNGKEQQLIGDIKIYPQEFFGNMKISDQTVFLHDHQLSWVKPGSKKFVKFAMSVGYKSNKFMDPILNLATHFQFINDKKVFNRARKKVKYENTKNIKK